MSLWLIPLLVLTHSAAMLIGFLWGDIRASDYVNRNWILMDEWRRFTASPWGAWMRTHKRKRNV